MSANYVYIPLPDFPIKKVISAMWWQLALWWWRQRQADL